MPGRATRPARAPIVAKRQRIQRGVAAGRRHTARVAPITTSVSGTRPAPLEQLRRNGRELEGGILAVDTGSSRWLIDTLRGRYQRIGRDADVERAIAFGTWDDYDRVEWHAPRTLVVVPCGAGTPVRALIR